MAVGKEEGIAKSGDTEEKSREKKKKSRGFRKMETGRLRRI